MAIRSSICLWKIHSTRWKLLDQHRDGPIRWEVYIRIYKYSIDYFIFFRKTFKHKISKNVQTNRENFAKICEVVLRKLVFDDGRSNKEWKAGWERMKEDGLYELDYFGDLFVVGKFQDSWNRWWSYLKFINWLVRSIWIFKQMND